MMDNLYELRDAVGKIKPLQNKLDALESRIGMAQEQVRTLLVQYEREQKDVERMQSNSFSAFVFKVLQSYEDKLEKEKNEEILAKQTYDRSMLNLEELSREKEALTEKLTYLHQEQARYEAELERRREWIELHQSDWKSLKYREIEEKRQALLSQRTEVDEALGAARRTARTIEETMTSLDGADSWATFDLWVGDGILSHMAKYSYVDKAEANFNRLSSQLSQLRTELSDVKGLSFSGLTEISSSRRAVDFWFDNIFTDYAVRSQIRENIEQLKSLRVHVNQVQAVLGDMDDALARGLDENRKQLEEILLGVQ